MNKNKSFVASIIAAIGSFMLLPLSFYWFFISLEEVGGRNTFFYVVFIALFILTLTTFVIETIVAIRLAKGKKVCKTYLIITMIINVLFVAFAITNLVILMLDISKVFYFEVILRLCWFYGAYIFASATSGASFAYKLVEMLKKN